MKKTIFLCLVFFMVFNYSHTTYSQQQELQQEMEIPEGYVLYQHQYAYLDIFLMYPENWINHSSQERGILIYTPDSQGSFMMLGSPLFGKEYTLEELWEANMESLKRAGAEFQESVPDILSGYPAIKALYTITIAKNVHQYICYSSIIGDIFYTFSFNVQEHDFEKYLEEVLTIVHSITIKS